jgi:hypothetical protein
MGEPKRIQRQRTKGWRMPDGAVYVGRPSRWGNPFRVGDLCPVAWTWRDGCWRVEPLGSDRVASAGQAVDRFAAVARQPDYVAAVRRELAGKDLACWCPLDSPCHADVLLEVASRFPPPERI